MGLSVRDDVVVTGEYGANEVVPGRYRLHYVGESGGSRFAFVECASCEKIYLAGTAPDLPPQALWPLPIPKAPYGLPPKVAEAFVDARLALNAGSKIGALMAGRTTLVRMLRDKSASQLKELVDRKELTPALYGVADQLRLWAAVAGHDDIEVAEFEDAEVRDVLDYLRTVLEAVYTHPAKASEFVARTKELKKQS